MKKKLLLILCLALSALALVACSSSAPLDKEAVNGGYANPDVMAPEIAPGYKEEGALGDTNASFESGSIPENQKLITTVYMTVESKEYDTLSKNLLEKLEAAGGYVENSKVSVRGVNNLRQATMVLRVPADKLDLLKETVEQGATVTNYEESSVDVSLTYADLEGRLLSLRAEQTALTAMLEKADSVSATIEIQKRLSQVRGEIESIESQLRVLDSKISFSTLTLTIYEVEKETVSKKELTFFEKIGEEFSENAKDTGEYLSDLAVFLIGGLPTLLSVVVTLIVILAPPAVVLLIVILIARSIVKKRKKNK